MEHRVFCAFLPGSNNIVGYYALQIGSESVSELPDGDQDALAKAASVGVSTVRDFEAGRRDPTRNNLTAMRAALEKGGISFYDDEESSGVRALKRRT